MTYEEFLATCTYLGMGLLGLTAIGCIVWWIYDLFRDDGNDDLSREEVPRADPPSLPSIAWPEDDLKDEDFYIQHKLSARDLPKARAEAQTLIDATPLEPDDTTATSYTELMERIRARKS